MASKYFDDDYTSDTEIDQQYQPEIKTRRAGSIKLSTKTHMITDAWRFTSNVQPNERLQELKDNILTIMKDKQYPTLFYIPQYFMARAEANYAKLHLGKFITSIQRVIFSHKKHLQYTCLPCPFIEFFIIRTGNKRILIQHRSIESEVFNIIEVNDYVDAIHKFRSLDLNNLYSETIRMNIGKTLFYKELISYINIRGSFLNRMFGKHCETGIIIRIISFLLRDPKKKFIKPAKIT